MGALLGTGMTDALPGLPQDTDGPVFREPWEAQAFAMTVARSRVAALLLMGDALNSNFVAVSEDVYPWNAAK